MAFLGWGLLLLVLAPYVVAARLSKASLAFLGALALLAATACAQWLAGKIVWPSQLVQLLYFLAVAAAVAWTGAQIRGNDHRIQIVDAWAWSWLLGCGIGVVVALVQYLQLQVPWYIVAPLADEGRVYGNVHQPNQFATLMALGLPCVVWLHQRGQLSMRAALAAALAVATSVVVTSSRTGLVELLWLAAWMALPSTRRARLGLALLAGAVLAYGVFYALDQAHVLAYFNGDRLSSLSTGMGLNDSRLALWRDTLALVAQNPWTGVGYGQLEFYRTFSDLPNALKTIHVNAHLLPLQIAVEYGLPVAVLFFALLVYALVKVGAAWRDPVGNFAMAGMVVVLIHSMTEFPLWYAFLLLPFAFLCGLYLGSPSAAAQDQAAPGLMAKTHPPDNPHKQDFFVRKVRYGALAILGGMVLSVTHYLPTIAMYVLNTSSITRDDRLATANRAFLYKHWIVYNSIGGTPFAEISRHPELLALFNASSRFYMNEFNIAQYALVLAENGRDELARRAVFALRRLGSTQLPALRAYCATATTPGARRLLGIIDSPTPPRLSASDFPP